MGNRQQQTLNYVAVSISELQPGHIAKFPRQYLSDIGQDVIDQVMALVPDSDRCISVFEDLRANQFRFRRLSQPLSEDDSRRTYVPTDQRERWTWDGQYWTPKPGATT